MANRVTDVGTEGLPERMARNEANIDSVKLEQEKHSKRLDKLEDGNEVVARMNVLVEMQLEQNKEQMEINRQQNEQFGKVNDTLGKVNNNLTLLNSGQEQMQQRVGELERTNDSNEKDWIRRGKDIFVTLVVAYLLFKFKWQ